MTQRTIVDFALRTDANVPLAELAAELRSALGCSFHEGEYRKMPALIAEILGVNLFLSPWRGIGGKRVFRLHGRVTEPGFSDAPNGEPSDVAIIDISAYVADLLDIRTPYRWYIPSTVDLDAENEHARTIDRAIDGQPSSEDIG